MNINNTEKFTVARNIIQVTSIQYDITHFIQYNFAENDCDMMMN